MKRFFLTIAAWLVVRFQIFLAFMFTAYRVTLRQRVRDARARAEIKRKLQTGEYELKAIFKQERIKTREWLALTSDERDKIGPRRVRSVFSGQHLQAVNQKKRRNRAVMEDAGVDYNSGRQRRNFRKEFNRELRRIRREIVANALKPREPLPTPAIGTDDVQVAA